jgi:hypothetical protein
MDTSTIISGVSLAVAAGTSIIAVVNHKRIRSRCCGRNVDMSIDIENTTPPMSIKIPVTSSHPEQLPKDDS